VKITKLSTNNRYLTKQFTLDDNSLFRSKDYDLAKSFNVELIDINDIHQLSKILIKLEEWQAPSIIDTF